MKDLKPLLKKLMERLSTPVRNCINKVWKRYEPQTVEQLIYLVDKCLKDRSGASDAERVKELVELTKLKDNLEEELEDLKKLLDLGKKKPPKPNNNPPKR